MSEDVKLAAVPDAPLTEEQQKQLEYESCEKSVLQLKRVHDLLQVGLFQGANGILVADGCRFLKHTIVKAEEELARLKPVDTMKLEKQDS